MQDYIQKNDEELFVLVQQNNELAFRTLYRRYNKQLYGFCRRMLSDDQAAEDAFQTVIVTIYEKRDSFTGGCFAAWMYAIARNRCIKLLRKEKPKVRLDDNAHLAEGVMTGVEEDTLLQNIIQTAIAKLPDDLREAFELRYLDDFQYDKIADIMGITLSLAKVRVFRARKIIQKILYPYLQELNNE